MKKIIQVILFLVATSANSQSHILIWKSDTLNIYSNPLELKNDWDQLYQVIIERRDRKRFGTKTDSVIEFIPWEFYKTKWLIENDSLYLTKISSFDGDDELNLQKLFQTEQRLIFADWVDESIITYDGVCIICTGNHGRNNSIYPNETVLKFQEGILSSLSNYRNFISKKSKFWSFNNPNDYLSFVYENINWSELPNMDNKGYQVYISVKPKQNGQLESIDWKNTYMIVSGESIIQNKENVFIKEAIRIAKKIPDWNVVFRQDKILNQGLTIVFSKEMKEKYAR